MERKLRYTRAHARKEDKAMHTDILGASNLLLDSSAAAIETSPQRLSDAPQDGQLVMASHSDTNVYPQDLRHWTFGRAFAVIRDQFYVAIVIPDDDNLASDGLTWLVASAAQCSTHSLAQAIVQFARERGQKLAEPTVFEAFSEYGARATIDGRVVLIGNRERMRDEGVDLGTLEKRAAELESIGRTVVYVAADGLKAGAMVIEDRALRFEHERESTPGG